MMVCLFSQEISMFIPQAILGRAALITCSKRLKHLGHFHYIITAREWKQYQNQNNYKTQWSSISWKIAPPQGWIPPSLSSVALSPSLLISPPLALNSTCLWCRVPCQPPDLLGRRGRRVSLSLLFYGCFATAGAGRLFPQNMVTWAKSLALEITSCLMILTMIDNYKDGCDKKIYNLPII